MGKVSHAMARSVPHLRGATGLPGPRRDGGLEPKSSGIATRSKKLLGTKRVATRSKKLEAKGIASRSKDATRGSWHRY